MRILLLFIVLMFYSCKPGMGYEFNTNYTTAYKLLYINDYGRLLDEKGFWSVGNDGYDFAVHKTIAFNYDEFKNYLNTLHKDEEILDFQYSYALVFSNKDTVYASHDLKKWILKTKGKKFFFSGPDDSTPDADYVYYRGIFQDSFFSECW